MPVSNEGSHKPLNRYGSPLQCSFTLGPGKVYINVGEMVPSPLKEKSNIEKINPTPLTKKSTFILKLTIQSPYTSSAPRGLWGRSC